MGWTCNSGPNQGLSHCKCNTHTTGECCYCGAQIYHQIKPSTGIYEAWSDDAPTPASPTYDQVLANPQPTGVSWDLETPSSQSVGVPSGWTTAKPVQAEYYYQPHQGSVVTDPNKIASYRNSVTYKEWKAFVDTQNGPTLDIDQKPKGKKPKPPAVDEDDGSEENLD